MTQCEFADAIRLGHGSALLHVKEYGDRGIEQTIKDAVVKNPMYDRFYPEECAEWLNRIVLLTGQPEVYIDYLLDQFCLPSTSLEEKAHQFLVASYFDQFGFSQFRSLMFDRFIDVLHTEEMSLCAAALYRVADHQSLFWIAGLCGKQEELIVDRNCFEVMREIFGDDCESDICAMAVASMDNSALEPFVLACKRHLLVERAGRSTLGDDSIGLAAREECRKEGMPDTLGKEFFKWVDGVSGEKFARFSELHEETRESRKFKKWLTTFKRETMPSFEELKELVFHADPDVRYVAAEVLSLSKCKEVRDLALQCLNDPKESSFSCGIEMLATNYKLGDVTYIQSALASIVPEREVDLACGDLYSLIYNYCYSELEPVVQWMVQKCPDQSTRFKAIEWLLDMDMCPLQLLWESQWDATSSSSDYARHELAKIELKRKVNSTG